MMAKFCWYKLSKLYLVNSGTVFLEDYLHFSSKRFRNCSKIHNLSEINNFCQLFSWIRWVEIIRNMSFPSSSLHWTWHTLTNTKQLQPSWPRPLHHDITTQNRNDVFTNSHSFTSLLKQVPACILPKCIVYMVKMIRI